MKLFLWLLSIAAFVAIWVTLLRPWLKTQSFAAPFFARIEPIEIMLWSKSETILWARFQAIVGALLATLAGLGTIDLSPVKAILPDTLKPYADLVPLIITLSGFVSEALRRNTSKPLAVVAAPVDAPGTLAANARVEQANASAVATVEAAKVT